MDDDQRCGVTRRGLLLAGGAAIALRPAVGQAVICENCSTIVQQLIDAALQAKQYAQELLSYANDLQQTFAMFQNLVSLPFQVFSTVTADIAAIQNISQLGSLLAGNSGRIVARLNSLGAAGGLLTGTVATIENIPNQMAMWGSTLGNSSNSLGQLLQKQQTLLAGYSSNAVQIQAHSAAAVGNLQIAQAGVEMASNNGDILRNISATLIGYTQASVTRDIVASDRKASEDAAMLKFTTPPLGDPPTSGGQGF